MVYSKIISTGAYVPQRIVKNDELSNIDRRLTQCKEGKEFEK